MNKHGFIMTNKGDRHSADPCAAHYGHPSCNVAHDCGMHSKKKLFWGSCQHFVRYLGCLAAVAELPHNLFHVCLGIALRNSVANLLPNVRRSGRCAGSATLHYVFLLLFSIEWLYECVFIFIALQQMMLQRLWTLTARICSHKLCNIMCMNPSRNFA